ncbi:ABC transporter substrate-binding protein [Methanonatronarchaeum sp. AMET-Sl]|uniref:ABC transporter substrate-binding protein n=1 Tax=Methanonatronarchaeum sp. AMET-Sl TaxID=3037654 RepID=UPI003265399B
MAAVVTVGGCLNPGFGNRDTVTITDQIGREVEVPEDVEKVVAVGSGALRLISYMLATDLVVGVEEFEILDDKKPYIMANQELQDLPNIGPQHGGDAEKIIGVNPDLVFASEEYDGDTDTLASKTGIPVIELKYGEIVERDRDTFYEALEIIGTVLGKEKRASEFKNCLERYLSDLKNRVGDIEEVPRLYVGGIGQRGIQGLTSTITGYPSLELIGFENMGGKLKDSVTGEHVYIDREDLVEYQPELIYIDAAGLEVAKEDLSKKEFKNLPAVKNGEVYSLLPYNYYNTQFENVLINSYLLGKHLVPDSFKDIDLEEIADDIYVDFLGEAIFRNMQDEFRGFEKIEI